MGVAILLAVLLYYVYELSQSCLSTIVPSLHSTLKSFYLHVNNQVQPDILIPL